ncbi:endonuclease-reverse transcriptase [Elysia marginata]|uniref:Endonuclease-reverse transcriptase n=1 Tax=Elysia marginata TaxID=1093978 RepID=A0AAV4JZ96_9GAST|nr:endonuclease-reverse transcriptase [Elysia marginata]
MTYGCQTWSMTKAVGQKLRVAQRAMERKMFGLKLTDKISCKEIRNKTQVSDIAQYIAKQKWKWAGHVARLQENRWTLRVTEWQPRNGKRETSKTMARRHCEDDGKYVDQRSERQRRVETWCGGPYPAVDGRSLKIKINGYNIKILVLMYNKV